MRPLRPSLRSARSLGWTLFAACALAAGSARALPPYALEQVDGGPGVEVGEYSSLRLDSQGRPHIAYYDAILHDLKYAWHDGLGWNVETADPSLDDVGQFAALALDTLDRPHVAYYNATARKLYYARRIGGAWIREVADSGSFDYGLYPSIAIDRHGRTWIASYDKGRGHPRVGMRFAGGAWTGSYVDTTLHLDGYYLSLAITGVDKAVPHVSYYDLTKGDLFYGTRPEPDQGWQVEVADSTSPDVGLYTSLVVDRFGRVHVCYADIQTGELRYALRDRTTRQWTHETVASAPDLIFDCSLALDPTGYPHISYHDGTAGTLCHARRDANGWQLRTVDDEPGIQGLYSSIECDSLGGIAISYMDGSARSLKFARGPSEVLLSAPPPAGGVVGLAASPNPVRSSASLRLSAHGAPAVAFELHDLTGRRLARLAVDAQGQAIWRPDAAGVRYAGIVFARALDRGGRTLATRRLIVTR